MKANSLNLERTLESERAPASADARENEEKRRQNCAKFPRKLREAHNPESDTLLVALTPERRVRSFPLCEGVGRCRTILLLELRTRSAQRSAKGRKSAE